MFPCMPTRKLMLLCAFLASIALQSLYSTTKHVKSMQHTLVSAYKTMTNVKTHQHMQCNHVRQCKVNWHWNTCCKCYNVAVDTPQACNTLLDLLAMIEYAWKACPKCLPVLLRSFSRSTMCKCCPWQPLSRKTCEKHMKCMQISFVCAFQAMPCFETHELKRLTCCQQISKHSNMQLCQQRLDSRKMQSAVCFLHSNVRTHAQCASWAFLQCFHACTHTNSCISGCNCSPTLVFCCKTCEKHAAHLSMCS